MRTDGGNRVADLSCEKLFMNYQDLNSGVQASREEAGTLEDADWWAGEPSLNISTADPEKFFASVLADLNNVNKLQVLELTLIANLVCTTFLNQKRLLETGDRI